MNNRMELAMTMFIIVVIAFAVAIAFRIWPPLPVQVNVVLPTQQPTATLPTLMIVEIDPSSAFDPLRFEQRLNELRADAQGVRETMNQEDQRYFWNEAEKLQQWLNNASLTRTELHKYQEMLDQFKKDFRLMPPPSPVPTATPRPTSTPITTATPAATAIPPVINFNPDIDVNICPKGGCPPCPTDPNAHCVIKDP